MRIRRAWLTLTLLAAGGCSTAPIADMMDGLKPGRLYPDTRTPYGGVCIPQGPGITGTTSRLEHASAATLREVIDINVYGALLCARAAVRRLSTARGGRGGSIVLLSSIASVIGGP